MLEDMQNAHEAASVDKKVNKSQKSNQPSSVQKPTLVAKCEMLMTIDEGLSDNESVGKI